MLRRARSFATFGVALIFVWSCITYYLAVHRPPPSQSKDGMLNDGRERSDRLRDKIAQLERDVQQQANANSKILQMIKEHEYRANGGNSSSASLSFDTNGNSQTTVDHLKSRIAVLVFSCNRPLAVRNHLDQLLKLRPSKEQFPVIVSQDCAHQETANAIKSYGDNITFMQHPDQSDISLPPKQKKFVGYYKIARHYRWALNQTFFKLGYENVIITEDDLDISIDFFEYFLAGYRLLKQDPTLWCVSSWNDNGKPENIENKSDLLYRTDFFGGLGWLLMKNIYMELEPSWPITFWDDWMRQPKNRKERACIRPEIPRTSMSSFGKVGVSKGLYFEKHLKFVKLNQEFVPFTKMDLTYLLKDKYDEPFVKKVYSSTAIKNEELTNGHLENGQPLPSSVRLTYTDQKNFKNTAKSLKIMEDAKAGVPRMAYRGVVPFIYNKIRVYLAPSADWKGYDTTWT